MSEAEYQKFIEEIERHVRRFIDEHPGLSRLTPLARRNMAYCAGHSALSALTVEELATPVT